MNFALLELQNKVKMLINSGIVGLGPAHKAVSLPSLVKLVPLFKFFQQNILSMCSIKRQVFLTVPSSSQIQEKTTPELYSSSVLLSVGSVLSTGKQRTSQVTSPCQRLTRPRPWRK